MMRRPAIRLFATLLAVGVAAACQDAEPAVRVLPLDQGWELRLAEDAPRLGIPPDLAGSLSTWIPATVPGTVHTDLLAAGLIPDPFWRDNELRLQWIGEESWTYRTTFQAGPEILGMEAAELRFHGLDTYAEVRLNGEAVLEADNMFREWRVEVTRQLRTGENTLEVRFRSPIPPALAARAALPYELPAGNDAGNPPSRVFVRKAAYHYGWDWGPRFVTQGIWRPVELVAWSGFRVTDLNLTTDSLSDGMAALTAHVELEVTAQEAERRAMGGGLPALLTLSSPEGAFGKTTYEALLEPGVNTFRVPLRIPDPRRWWPNGLGEPHLYTVQAHLKTGRLTDTRTTRIGLRTLELVIDPDSIGEAFFFRVNGVPVFMKGANVIPSDHFSPRVTEGGYRSLFRDVATANMNMLRVWGGGIYETDLFYDLADEHGILLWQDFMFANGMYPGDPAFLNSVRAEAVDQVRRLRGHPSLALWCGNNEMDEGWQRWGWARAYASPEDSAAVRKAYEALFYGVLPDVVSREDPTRAYWPSSPMLGWGDPESLNRGDSHYWGVWHGQEPFGVFAEKLPRFSSEFGFQAFPPMETIEAFSEEADRSLFHPVMLVHQKHPIGNDLIATYMERDYPVPSGFEDFVYVSQLLQARGMRTAFEAHRRAMPRTMGTLYWQLNDTWPVVSWSGRDYFGRWKALHYAAREAFAPFLVSAVLVRDTVEVWGVWDGLEPRSGSLQVELLDFAGTVLWQAPVPVSVPATSSRLLWRMPLAELLGGADPRRVVLAARFLPGGDSGGAAPGPGSADPAPPGSLSVLYFRTPRELELRAPAIRLEVAAAAGAVDLTLTSDILAKDVALTLDAGSRFHANFFDLLPGRPRTIHLETSLTPEEVRTRLRIRTLAEVPREGIRAGG